MSCCDPTNASSKQPKKRCCPVDNREYTKVAHETLLHHLKSPWLYSLDAQQYYFCDNPDCEIVYFGNDDSMIKTSELRGTIGQKQTGKDKRLCYCFDVTLGDIEKTPSIKDFVVQQTKLNSCACETRNPSGRCCLKDFPKIKSSDTGTP